MTEERLKYMREYMRRYRAAHPKTPEQRARAAQYMREYYARNREAMREKMREYMRRYRAEHPEKVEAARVRNLERYHERRAERARGEGAQ